MRGAGGDNTAADLELYRIAAGVISRVQASASVSVGWPLPGTWPAGSVADDGTTDISGDAYSDTWPANLLENAITLFAWRTVKELEQATDNQRRAGDAAEKFFVGVEGGSIGLGLGVSTEPNSPSLLAARNRDGTSNVASVPDQDNLLDAFAGDAWDG